MVVVVLLRATQWRRAAVSPQFTISPLPNIGVTSRPSIKAPLGYKLVKVRKVNGTIITVKKKLSPKELAAENTNITALVIIPKSKTDYEVIVIRIPDRTFRKVKQPLRLTRLIPVTNGAILLLNLNISLK